MSDIENKPYVLSTASITDAVRYLRSRRTHRNFSGYLCVKKKCREVGDYNHVKPNFKQFFEDYLRPADGDAKKPYISPFVNNGDLSSDIWTNPNVAGSYAPSSLRGESPFRKVVSISGVGSAATYSLLKNSSENVFNYLLFEEKLSVLDLVIFLYRDMVFTGNNVTSHDLIEIFKNDFGFRDEITLENKEYRDVFLEDIGQYNKVIFEQY